MFIERQIKKRLHRTVASRPVTLLTGARQTGKSSLLQHEFPAAEYITLDYMQYAEAAQSSPAFFLRQFAPSSQVILDEIQYAPQLMRELKAVVDDERDNYGKWILTGSQHSELMHQVSQSLAGRIGFMHLETLSAAELRRSPLGLERQFLWQGGYPELWRHPELDFVDFCASYMRTYIERDLRHIIEVRNLYDFQRFVRLLALRTGQIINYTDIAKDTGVSDATARNWLHGLELSGLVYLLPPYHANIGKRLIKTPKLYFADHGLLCYLLSIYNERDWYAHPNRGHIWENLSFLELIKQKELRPGENLFFYRDQNGVEIDFVLEQGQKIYLIEAKAAERVPPAKLNFAKVAPLLAPKRETVSLLLHNSEQPIITQKEEYYALNPLRVDLAGDGSLFDQIP